MSILAKLKKPTSNSGVFGIVCGERLSGKSTIAGTLPGRTLMLQADLRETGSVSAIKLAESLGNKLDVYSFANLRELGEVIKEFPKLEYDNLYIDGISAITEMKYNDADVQQIVKTGNKWDAFDKIKQTMLDVIMYAKSVTLSTDKNVFMTLALSSKVDPQGVVTLVPELKGQATLALLKGLCPVVVSTTYRTAENGVVRELITKNSGHHTARIDTLLDHQNPGLLPADLGKLLSLIRGV